MPTFRRLPLCICLLSLSLPLSAQVIQSREIPPARASIATQNVAEDAGAPQWLAHVRDISAAADNTMRRATIERILQSQSLDTRPTTFNIDDATGINLLAPVSGKPGAPLLLIGAHYDRVDQGDGVTDNASGVAVVLTLAQRFKAMPLRHHRVAIALWDLEEKGLLGARAYVEQGGEKPALYVNFDVFGWGDTLWMMSPDPRASLVGDSEAAARDAGVRLSAGTQYPPTDHLAFQKAGWPAVSYSLVDHAEISDILQVFAGKQPASLPKVMRVIHSDNDTLSQVDADAVSKGIDAVEKALRRWDVSAVVH